MEKQMSTVERFQTWVGLVSTLLSIILGILGILSKYDALPEWLKGLPSEYHIAWWGFFGALLLAGVWLLRMGLGPKSRLLKPDRFLIRPEESRHLKGRGEEIRELADLCERQPLVFLEGEAGAGKSALTRAGLMDECCRRGRLHPVYLDLSGAGWEDPLASLLSRELWHSLSEGDRQALELKSPCSPGEIFALLTTASLRFDRKPLLIFDQFDDYQSTYGINFREGMQGSTWITKETLTRINSFWRHIAQLVQIEAICCLFITRTDNAAGLDTVRFTEARIYRLARASRNLIAPILEEISTPESDGRPVVSHPERGWEILKGRLLSDLAEDDFILPVRLSVALQALRRLPVLTVREYEKHGGAEGLELIHMERNISETSQTCGLSIEQVRKTLLALVDPVRHKTVQVSTAELMATLDQRDVSPNETPARQLQKALEYLECRGIVRRRPGEQEARDVWLLQHDFLCRGLLAVERRANRWRALLQDRASQYRESAGILRCWSALLSPGQQVRLLVERLFGRFRYAGDRRFALLSTFRFLPYVLLLASVWGATQVYRIYEDEYLAHRIIDRPEGEQIRAMASSSERVHWRVLELAFASEMSAKRAEREMDDLLHICLCLDPTGDNRKRFWKEIARPALEKDPGPGVVLLALTAWKKAPGDAAETQLLARMLTKAVLKKEYGLSELVPGFAALAPHLDAPLAQSLSDELLRAMAGEAEADAIDHLAEGLVPFVSNMTADQVRSVAGCLLGAIGREAGNNYYCRAFGKWLLVFTPYLDSGNSSLLTDCVANAVRFNLPLRSSEVSTMVEPDDDLKGKLLKQADDLKTLLEKLDVEQARAVAEKLVTAMMQEENAFQLADLARSLALLKARTESEPKERAIRRVVDVIEREKGVWAIEALAGSLEELAPEVGARQMRLAAEKVLQEMEREKDFMQLGSVMRMMRVLASRLEPEEAHRAAYRLMEVMRHQERLFVITDHLAGLSAIATRLNGEQVGDLMEDLVTQLMSSPQVAFFPPIINCLKYLAGLLSPEQAETIGRGILEAVEREKDAQRLRRLRELAAAMAASLDSHQLGRMGELLVQAMEQAKKGDSIGWLGERLADLQDRVDGRLLHRGAMKLMEAVVHEGEKFASPRPSEALAGIVERLETADVRRIAEAMVQFGDREVILQLFAKLGAMEGRFSEQATKDLAEQMARRLEQAASKGAIYRLKEPGRVQNVAALLQHATDQSLVNILKRPFLVDSLQMVVLRAWELKYGQQFDGDLWRFVAWATTDPRTRRLDFRSPPRRTFPQYEDLSATSQAKNN